ncbi:hypothetical protein QT990_07200 [Microcoleus sp. T3_B1]|uniref:hypothetical protein n=1 Tax=Microcoleus sp. T3_B1 TaxID=3055425 RepID=UPI002FD245B4
MPVPQRKNQFSCGAYHCQEQARCLFHKERISFLVGRIIVKNRQDACSTKKELVFLWGGHLARPKKVYMDKT